MAKVNLWPPKLIFSLSDVPGDVVADVVPVVEAVVPLVDVVLLVTVVLLVMVSAVSAHAAKQSTVHTAKSNAMILFMSILLYYAVFVFNRLNQVIKTPYI
jgi:hypothetical protein